MPTFWDSLTLPYFLKNKAHQIETNDSRSADTVRISTPLPEVAAVDWGGVCNRLDLPGYHPLCRRNLARANHLAPGHAEKTKPEIKAPLKRRIDRSEERD